MIIIESCKIQTNCIAAFKNRVTSTKSTNPCLNKHFVRINDNIERANSHMQEL